MTSFSALGLSGATLEAIQTLGFENPTPVQERVIPLLLQKDTDLVALAQTGTGKTAAFGLPLIERLDTSTDQVQALVLAPTRELCVQIAADLERFAVGQSPTLRIVSVYGGSSISDQIKKIKRGVHIMVATPGRLMDLMERKVARLQTLRYVVLDEADEMLNMGFQEDIDHILADTPEQKNVWLFSATMPKAVRAIAQAYMRHPEEVTLGNKNQGNENIDHQYVVVDERHRYDALKRLVDYHVDIFGVIFCRTKLDTQRIAEHLIRDGYNADALHGDLTQQQRDKVMGSFRNRTLQLLVATDVAARGIDVNNVTHVIHMNLPDELEFYTHRSGRTARAGKKGISLAIVTRKEVGRIRQIEKVVQRPFERVTVPTGAQVCQQRLLKLITRLREVQIAENEIGDLLPVIYDALAPLSKEEVIKRFTSLEFNHLLDYYRDASDLNEGSREGSAAREDRYVTGDRLFINIGKMDGLDKGKLLGFICDRTGIKKNAVGKIDIKGAYSFFEVDKSETALARERLHGFEYKGRLVRVEVTGETEAARGSRSVRETRKKDKKSNWFESKKKQWR